MNYDWAKCSLPHNYDRIHGRNDPVYKRVAREMTINSNVYIRECYDEISVVIFKQFAESFRHRKLGFDEQMPYVYLIGTPGVGNSAFLFYFADSLGSLGVRVVLGSDKFRDKHFWLWSGQTAPL